eukprot:4928749-Karenia_brevis.AAC.1
MLASWHMTLCLDYAGIPDLHSVSMDWLRTCPATQFDSVGTVDCLHMFVDGSGGATLGPELGKGPPTWAINAVSETSGQYVFHGFASGKLTDDERIWLHCRLDSNSAETIAICWACLWFLSNVQQLQGVRQ